MPRRCKNGQAVRNVEKAQLEMKSKEESLFLFFMKRFCLDEVGRRRIKQVFMLSDEMRDAYAVCFRTAFCSDETEKHR